MSYSITEITAIVSVTLSAIYYTFSFLKGRTLIWKRGKKEWTSSFNILSDGINQFYLQFSPPITYGSRKASRSYIYSTLSLIGIPIIVYLHFEIHLNAATLLILGLILATIETYITFLFAEFYVAGRASALVAKLESKSSIGGIKEAGDLGDRQGIYSTLIILVFLLFNLYLTSYTYYFFNVYFEVLYTVMLLLSASYALFFTSFMINKTRMELEFLLSRKYFQSYEKKVILELYLHIDSVQNIKSEGTLLALGKSLYILRSDGMCQEIKFNNIRSVSAKEIIKQIGQIQ
ncbi:MAG: hypothetical protein M1526_01170 [Candidatus Thermoplasmatota archaeon]|nr:hypothetical protein [Candidatus Thermoplasmatota archaeon]